MKRRTEEIRTPELILKTRYGQTIFIPERERIIVLTENRNEFLMPAGYDGGTLINQVRELNNSQIHHR